MNVLARRQYPNQSINQSINQPFKQSPDTLCSLLGRPCRLHAAESSASVQPRVGDLRHRSHLHAIKQSRGHPETVILTVYGSRDSFNARNFSLQRFQTLLDTLELVAEQSQLPPQTIPTPVRLRLLAGAMMTPACVPPAHSTPPGPFTSLEFPLLTLLHHSHVQ
jgi:hypothetical protein